ncbi:iron-siderophore ABC transporter substrate-binding protein [Pseudonocardia sp. NPDC046786]|uniref:iron-siderophore ABC transporter substrate-binding protein n=1 Tax=Pseudonocardia sp. NPDC046786 TaxID=3155471 RepID=UPI0033C6C768
MIRKILVLPALLALVTGCSHAPDDPAAPGGEAGGAFPVGVEHVFGTTEIPERPARVVALGVTDADPVLALGVTPVGLASYTFYEETGGLGPWARDLVQGEPPVVLAGEPNLEQIAALAPDVIFAVSAGIEQPMYDQLSAIAPVVARPVGTIAYGVPRDEHTRIVATALGEPERGEELIRQADAAFTDAVAANPQFQGRTGATVLPFDGKYGAFTTADNRGRFMTGLGLVQPPRIDELDTGESFYVEVSSEQAGLLDGDVLVMLADEGAAAEQVARDAVLAQVPVVAQDRMIVPDADTRGAMTYNSVLSAPFALERLVPGLQAALGS